ncbi:MAG: ZIP family metal transporter [Brumimicrobium sp.]|nr:ZIP family metal transporter [Brumimicrobium sp.]
MGIILLILSVLLGGAIVVYLQHFNRERLIKILLSLSGGFLLAIAFVHFIPEIYANHTSNIGYYILLGFLFQLLLEYFSKGIEHGHIHAEKTNGAIPWSLFLALSIHAFFEGIPLEAHLSGAHEVIEHFHTGHEHVVMKSLLLGIILHKIPMAIALMTLLLNSGFSKLKAWMVVGVFSLMAPSGMLFGRLGVGAENLEIILAIVVGMFLHISTTIIFESSENHRFNFIKLVSLLAGVGLAILVI